MKTLFRVGFILVGFGITAAMAWYLDPAGLDAAGFSFFYLSLAIGSFSLFLLLRLTQLQSILLSFLLISFLLLQQLHFFRFWLGVLLVMFVIFVESYATGTEKN